MNKMISRERLRQTLLSLAGSLAPQQTGQYIARLFLTPKRHERPDWEKALIRKAVDKNLASGRRAWSWGESEKRVLLVHGWEGRGSQLGSFVEPLVAEGFEVIAWDGPAHGDSPGEMTDLSEFSRALAEDIAQLGPFEAIVAHSMGGAALMLAVERGLIVNKSILIASPSQWSPVVRSLGRRLNLRAETLQAVVDVLEARVGEPMDQFDVEKWHLKNSPSTLVLHDEKDRDVPTSEFERLLKNLPSARGKLYSGLGHRRILKDAGVISEVVQFIKKAA